jgi:tetratricopeptide (TPR) repeat protein
MHLSLLLACLSHYEPGVAWAPHHEPLPPALVDVFQNQDLDAMMEEAVARSRSGDHEGAIQRLVWLERQSPGDFAVLYQLGMAYEGAGRLEHAVSVYDRMEEADTDQQWVLDWGFRRALCLEELGRFEEAIGEYRALPTPAAAEDAALLDLALAVAEFRGDRGSAKAVRKSISRAALQPDTEWMRAKAHVTLAEAYLVEAADYTFDVGDRKQAKNLKARAHLILAAEDAIAHAVRLEQVEWILKGLLALGDGYSLLAADLLQSRVPAKVDAELYREALEKQAQIILAKAYTAYDQGIVVAGKFAVTTPLTEQLAASRDALDI